MSRLCRLSLRARLLLVVLLPAALLAASVAGLFMLRGTQAADEAMRDRALAIASFLAPAAEYGVVSGNPGALSGLLQAALEQRDVAAVAIYDREGDLLSVSGRPWFADPARIRASAAASMLEEHEARLTVAAPVLFMPLVIDDVLEPYSRNPHPNGSQPEAIGWVYLELDTRQLLAQKREIVLTTLVLTLGGLGLTAVLAVRLARSVAVPVAQLAAAVDRIADGALDVSVPDSAGSDELRALERGFNTMARSIADAHQTLQARVNEATAQLAYQALHDPLTGLPNRRAFEQALEEAVGTPRRAADHGALCFIDLDRFKIVNDTCGHAAGDELLREIASEIRHRVRAQDLICRIGGDEFALLLRACRLEEAQRIAESLREAIAAHRFECDGRVFSVGASVGLVPMDGALESVSEIMVAADLACYSAKKSGRNQVVTHIQLPSDNRDVAAPPSADPTYPLASEDSVPFERLSLHGQAIVALDGAGRSERLSEWVEVLLRYRDARGRIRAPRELLSQLAGDEDARQLDAWVADQACALAAGAAATLHLSLNLSNATLDAPDDYLAALAAAMARHDVAPGRIVLEFPADAAARHGTSAAHLVATARALGCSIALERLEGTSVGVLRSLRPDYAKINLSLLGESYGLEAAQGIAQALCGMATALGVACVASETEDLRFRHRLHELGFDYAQGRLIDDERPLPDWLAERAGATPRAAL